MSGSSIPKPMSAGVDSIPDDRFRGAARLYEAGKPREAEHACQELLADHPDFDRAWHLTGIARLQAGDAAGACQALGKAAALNGGQALYHHHLAKALMMRRRPSEAAASLRRALRRDPSSIDAWLDLGALLAETGKPKAAATAFAQAAERAPENADAHLGLGDALKQSGRAAEAVGSYRRALALRPGDIAASNNLGAALRETGAAREAVEVYRRLLDQGAEQAEIHYNLGLALWESGARDEALGAFRRAIELNPGLLTAHHNLATALTTLGRGDEALPSFRRALEIEPGNENAGHMLAALTGQTTPTAPASYVRELFRSYAPHFDRDLTENLGYRVPELLREAAARAADNQGRPPGARFARALDLGCGTGLVGARVRDMVGALHGLDLSEAMLARAEAKGFYDRLFLGNLIAWLEGTEDDDPYDLMLAADLFIYLGDLGPAFAAIRRRLAPDGVFAFSVETAHDADYVLRPTGRYAQSGNYIRRLAGDNAFGVAERRTVNIRKDKDGWIAGRIFVLIAEKSAALTPRS